MKGVEPKIDVQDAWRWFLREWPWQRHLARTCFTTTASCGGSEELGLTPTLAPCAYTPVLQVYSSQVYPMVWDDCVNLVRILFYLVWLDVLVLFLF